MSKAVRIGIVYVVATALLSVASYFMYQSDPIAGALLSIAPMMLASAAVMNGLFLLALRFIEGGHE